MKYKKALLGLFLLIIFVFITFFGLRGNRQALHQNEGADWSNSGLVSSRTPTGSPKFTSRRVANGNQQSADPWTAYVEEKTERLYQDGLKNSEVEPPADFRDTIREAIEAEAAALKKQYTLPPLRIGVEIPEKYTGPQTVEALMETFEAYDRQGAQGDDLESDEKYPRAEWLAMFLEKEVVIRNYTDYSHCLGIRGNLISFEREGHWVEGTQGVPPTDDWETFKAAYIDRQAWEHQQMSMARQNDPNVFGGLFTGPDNRTYLPGRANRVYVERRERGAFFHGAPLTEKQQWDIMLQGKHPEGYEIIYIDENGTILSEPPPPIPPPTGEERRQLETWLRRGKSQPPETSADASSQTSEDWDIRGQDSPLEAETVRAAAQATQKRFEQAQTEALERATKSDVEIDAELEKLLTPEPTTPFDPEAWEGLSPEQRKRAKLFFDQYGAEEGLRRLRVSHPEAAEQFERERNNPPGRDAPPVKDEKATPSTQ